MAFSMKLPATKGNGSSGKQYGLIVSNKKGGKKELLKPASVFGGFDDANEATTTPGDAQMDPRRRVVHEAARSVQQALVDRLHEKALAEDPSVFDYDGVYDEIQSSRQDKVSRRKAQRETEKAQSKYIGTLMEKAKVREIELDRVRERRLLKEREADDAQYGDKEKLISASYKRKLQEMKRWDEEDARLDAKEAAEDVTKRGNEAMVGFYSNLLTKNIAMGGDTSNSHSAYTVGKDNKERERSRSRDRREDRPRSRSPSPRRDTEHKQEARREDEPLSVKKQRVEDEQPKPAPEEVKLSKEEVISAAKARFLARKAQRAAAATES
ncbi:hypothetical protein Poli38472_012779 [Pythium oligandrum]|uniref:Nuclear speckle splicing regulatory protein 1 N-terminal domain-containing protein n=1 Tax=Pythium oligandrum TaxID=41045 RepID=A0A8K1FKC2_PYTOL|nr:hypothetical protein Poli38472_012779 [Pythium oligandrum]|eukprot:TMW61588.1 hypothetical protein Poli38472_012779 [Pythium oligandrum]